MGLGLEMKRSNNAEIQKKVEDMLETLKKSDHAHLFNQLLAKDDALYEKYGKNQMTLSFIELNIKMGRYQSTFKLGQDIRQMVAVKMEVAMESADQDSLQKVQGFLVEFDQSFQGLDNLPLGKTVDAPVKPPPKQPQELKGKQIAPKGRATPVSTIDDKKKQPQPKPKSAVGSQGTTQPGVIGAGGVVSGSVVIQTAEPSMTAEEVSQLKMKIETQLTPEQKKGILPIIKAEVMQQ